MTSTWDEMYREHAPRLRRLIARRVDAVIVDDVLQETFLRAYRSRQTLDPTRPVGAWLTTIALRTVVDFRERHGTGQPSLPLDVGPSAEEEFLVRQQGAAITAAFSSLTTRQRRLLASVALDDIGPTHLAARDGLDPQAIRAALSRARRSFRAAYTRFADTGLTGIGGSLRPALTRLRARLQRVEPFVARPIEVLAVGMGALGLGMSTAAVQNVPLATLTTAHLATPAGASTAGRVGSEPAPVAVDSVPSPTLRASVVIDSETAGRSDIAVDNGFVTLRNETLGAQATVGTDGRTGTVSIGHETDTGQTYGGVTVRDCEANPGTQAECAVISTLEQVADHAD